MKCKNCGHLKRNHDKQGICWNWKNELTPNIKCNCKGIKEEIAKQHPRNILPEVE